MERESRHSKEEEEELDRKIAQIREKNLKIEERKKEIDADRANHTDQVPRKPSKPSSPRTANAKTGKGEWDREWDHGKTPAETWRENVPSIDIVKKSAGRGGHQRPAHRGQRGGQKSRGAPRTDGTPNNTQVSKGNRLEGRVSVQHQDSGTPRGRGRGRGSGRLQDRHATQGDDEVKNNNVRKNDGALNHARNTRQNAKSSLNSKDDSTAKNASGKKTSKRRYTEKYEIKQLLRRIVNKVEKNERKERQKEKLAAEKKAGAAETKHEKAKEPSKNTSEAPSKTSPPPSGEVAPEQPKPKDDGQASPAKENQKENHVETGVQDKQEPPVKTEEAKNEANGATEAAEGADANQNVIKLVEEKVLQIQMS